MNALKEVKKANKIVFSNRKYLSLGIISFIGFLTLYLFTLPATFTGGRIGFISLQFLTLKLALFSILMAFFISLVIPFTVFGFKHGIKTSKASVTGGFLGSVLPPILCCSPFIPTVLALVGATSFAWFGVGGAIQGFIATYETQFFSGATLLLAYATVQSAKSTNKCLC